MHRAQETMRCALRVMCVMRAPCSKRAPVLSVRGGATLRDNIIDLYTLKQVFLEKGSGRGVFLGRGGEILLFYRNFYSCAPRC